MLKAIKTLRVMADFAEIHGASIYVKVDYGRHDFYLAHLQVVPSSVYCELATFIFMDIEVFANLPVTVNSDGYKTYLKPMKNQEMTLKEAEEVYIEWYTYRKSHSYCCASPDIKATPDMIKKYLANIKS